MTDKLKEHIQQHRSAFDMADPPDLWPVINASLHVSSFALGTKLIKAMIKYGFGASVVVITTLVAVNEFNKTPKNTSYAKAVKADVSVHQPVKDPDVQLTIPAGKLPVEKPFVANDTTKNLPFTVLPVETPYEGNEIPPQQEVMFQSPVDTSRHSAFNIDTVFKGIRSLEVRGIACNINIDDHTGEEVHFSGKLSECSGNMIVRGSSCTMKSYYTIRYKKESDLLKVWIEEVQLNKKEKFTLTENNSNNESVLNFKVPSGTNVNVVNQSGNINVSGIKSEKCELKTDYGNIKTEKLNGNIVLNSQSGNIKAADIKGKIKSITSYGNQEFNNVNGNISITSSSGNVNLSQLSGDAEVITSYGHQKYTNIKGDITGTGASGNISINHMEGNAIIKSSYGHQDFNEIKGDLTCRAESGGIRINNSRGKLSAETSYGNILGKNVSLSADSEFRAVSGNINFTLLNEMKDLKFDLTSSSGNLRVQKESTNAVSDTKLQAGDGKIIVRGISSFGNQIYK